LRKAPVEALARPVASDKAFGGGGICKRPRTASRDSKCRIDGSFSVSTNAAKLDMGAGRDTGSDSAGIGKGDTHPSI
jgi:hypothetical protein